MKKSLMAFAVIAALGSASAFASCGNGGGPASNGCDGSTSTAGGAGGAGGMGGAGGNGYGVGVGVGVGQGGNATGGNATGGVGLGGAGGSVLGSGNSTATGGAVVGSGNSTNNIRNTNTNAQGQIQGQQQSIRNSGNSSISGSGNSRNTNTAQGGVGGTGGSVGNISVNVSTPDTSVAQTASADRQAAATEKAAALQAAAAAAPQTIKYEGIPAATAYAAPLTATNGTCMGSTSGGLQGTFGLSFGTTWTDTSCDIRYDAEALRAAGLPTVAIQRLCQKPEIAKAMEAAGQSCAGAKPTAAVKTSAAAEVPVEQVAYTDPIVRQRLGLPPLSR